MSDIFEPTDREPDEFHGIVTVSPEMRKLFERIRRVARTDATVLVRGASGTGKELVAKAIHACSPRGTKPFRAVNCATFTPDLLASELFGHVRGAFTGAVRDRPGLFALADWGSLFLDEVAEMPLDIQARLLRVLQERTYIPVGGSTPQFADVRIVSATNKGLREEVAEGRFREDLMYRIRVVVLYLPTLAERAGDVEALTWHFIERLNGQGFRQIRGIERAAMDAMLAYSWPGNVRELRNNLEQAVAIGEGPILRLEELAPELQESPGATLSDPPSVLEPAVSTDAARPAVQRATTYGDVERDAILDALRESRGRRGDAAKSLGISRSTLWRKIKLYGLD